MAQGNPSIEVLSDRSHLLLRPAMYIGATDSTEIYDFNISGDSIKYESISIVPGLLKIINEVIDNSIDAAIRADFKCGTNISVKIDKDCVTIKDDGSGIPSQKVNGKYPAELCWGFARAGSNFGNDAERKTVGMNGIGSYATNVYSTKFIGVSDDGSGCVKFISKNNAESYEVKPQESKSRGTCVTFYPDLKRFKVSEIDETHKNAIYQRLINLSVCYPQINFKFNGKAIKISNFKKLAELFSKDSVIYENSGISIAIAPNATDDFKQYSYVNGLKISDGGTHIDTIMNQVVSLIREKLQRKYKSIKPGDIKNKLTCIVFMRGFPNAKFNSQSKEKITNSIKEFNDFTKIDYSFVNKILRNDAIVNPIIDIYKIKEEYENRKALKSVETKKKLKSEKYFRATKEPKYLCICEGFSAYGGISPVLGNSEFSFYCLKGKPLNTWEVSNQKMVQNREMGELYKILNEENFDYILTTTDQDLDAFSIIALLCGFIEKYAPQYKNKFGRMNTPIKMAHKSGKPVRWVYDFNTEFEPLPGEEIKYYKGLGSHQKEHLEQVIKTDGLENMIELFNFDDIKVMAEFLATEESDARKEYIRNNNFSIAKV